MVLQQSQPTPLPDVVDDSEPEREERRRLERLNRKRAGRPPVRPTLDVDVIELTDSDGASPVASNGPLHFRSPSPPSVIDITDSSSNFPARPISVTGRPIQIDDDTGEKTSFPSVRALLQLPRDVPCVVVVQADAHLEKGQNAIAAGAAAQAVPNPNLSRELSLGGTDDEDDNRLKLTHFAYTKPSLLSRHSSSKIISRSASAAPTESNGALPAKKKVVRPAPHRFISDFSETELARMLKCVACDLAWTTRKTVTEKMRHIQSCAKKHALTDDTVRILIRAELKTSPPMIQGKGKGKGKASAAKQEQDVDPQTLLEDVVLDGNMKKKGRRAKVLETVKSVTETRESILDRARQLIGDTGSARGIAAQPNNETKQPAAGGWMPPPTQAFGTSALARHHSAPSVDPEPLDGPPATQAFARSKFGAVSEGAVFRGSHRVDAESFDHLQARPQRENTSSESSHEEEELPMTQAFAPSRFSGAANAVSNSALACSSANDVFLTRASTLSSPLVSAYAEPPAAGASADPFGLHVPCEFHSVDIRAQGDQDDHYNFDYDYNPHNPMRDDVCLEFEPEGLIAGPSRLLPDSPPPERTKKTSKNIHAGARKSPPRSRSPMPPLSASPPQMQPAEPAAKKSRSRKKPDSAKNVQATQPALAEDEFNARMRDAVSQDASLHLRVLRYEPIPFGEFMQLAADIGLPGRGQKFKAQVRDFLDKQAIHFYGAELAKSRTRRHP